MADSEIVQFTKSQAREALDKFSRIEDGRQIKPLDRDENISYDHYALYDQYNLRIGDVNIMIPPSFIHVASESFSQNVQTLRQENSQKLKTGYHKRTINIDLVFNGLDEINGYKVHAPKHKDGNKESYVYYVDGLRELLAQFKVTPFLPIENDLINQTYKIYTVALQQIVVSTIDGFQNALSAHLILQEVNMTPYIEMPDMMFDYVIDWDLFRYYTQSMLTNNHIYKKLQALPSNKDHTAFKLSILNEECLSYMDKSDKKSGESKEESILAKVIDPKNYTTLVNSDKDSVHITSFKCGYSNMLTSIQMAGCPNPTLQFLGGMDTQFAITFETTSLDVIDAIEQCQILNDQMVRNNPKIRGSIGFVKLEADLVTFCGSLFMTIESVETHTVEGMPGLYNVTILCVSYDIAQSRREKLNGFLPFDGTEVDLQTLSDTNSEKEVKASIGDNATQSISQSMNGLLKKIYQDNYAEYRLRNDIEIYPDLHLPTYKEVNVAIANIRLFRQKHNLTQLPYSKYPQQPNYILAGKKATFKEDDQDYPQTGGANVIDVNATGNRAYDGYVDPDFYIFYPNGYKSYDDNSDTSLLLQEKTVTETKVQTATYSPYDDSTNKLDQFVILIKKEIGKHYAFKCEGDIRDNNGQCFDSFGLLTYALKQLGILPNSDQIIDNKYIYQSDIFEKVDLTTDQIKKGDVCLSISGLYCKICTGNDLQGDISVIGASRKEGVHEEKLLFTPPAVYRITPLQINSTIQGTSQSNPYITTTTQLPDENGTITQKKKTALESTTAYTSTNPYGDDSNKAAQASSASLSTNDSGSSAPLASTSGVTVTPEFLKLIEDYEGFLSKSKPLDGGWDIGFGFHNQYIDPNGNLHKVTRGLTMDRAYAEKCLAKSMEYWVNLAIQKVTKFGWKVNEFTNNQILALASYFYNRGSGNASADAILNKKNSPTVEAIGNNLPNYWGKSAKAKKGLVRRRNAEKALFFGQSSAISATATSTSSTVNVTSDNSNLIKEKENNRRNRAASATQLATQTTAPQLQQADISGLNLPNAEDDGSPYTDGTVKTDPRYEAKTMTLDEYNSLAEAVAIACEGEKLDSMMAMSQELYDLATDPYHNYGGITAILTNTMHYKPDQEIEDGDLTRAKNCIANVFFTGMRFRKNWRILRHTGLEDANIGKDARGVAYSFVGSIGTHNYYGFNESGAKDVYTISGTGVSEASNNDQVTKEKKALSTKEVSDINKFGQPLLIKTDHFDTHDAKVGVEFTELNSDENRINTAFVDECQYSAKGRLVKAFPSFMLAILDDDATWYDAKKLWTNYYIYKPVVDINYHAAYDMPIETATITVTNTYHNLDRNSATLSEYDISSDKSYTALNRWLYKNFGMILGSKKLTSRLIQLHSILFNHTQLKEGARVHLRIGYGSDPMGLAPIINGTITGLQIGDTITIVITSDGNELIQDITSSKEKDVNNGAFGTGIGATQEASNLIANIMVKRQSWVNHLMIGKNWYEGSKYHIEHFGLYINAGDHYALQGGIDTGKYEQYDLLMNIYHAATKDGWINNYRHLLYMYGSGGGLLDGESNITFNKYNMTPWDVFQLCAQTTPEFIVKPDMYQFDSRLFFGLPFELIKYRYDIIDDDIYQECKASTQVHYIDTISNIIENQVSVTSRRRFTNAKVIYTRGSTPKATSIIHSDDTIDNAKQSTHIIDSPIVQDYLGSDAFNEAVLQIKQGKNAARKLGISNIMYGWEQEYQGQVLCLGTPQVKPHDYIIVNDYYTNLNGLALVREVVHSFNTQTGFTSSITPGIIAFCPEQDTGNIPIIAALLSLYSQFAEITQQRKYLLDQSQRYAQLLYFVKSSLKDIDKMQRNEIVAKGLHTASTVTKDILLLKQAHNIFTVIRNIDNITDIIDVTKGIFKIVKNLNTMTEGTKVFQSVRTLINTMATFNKVAKTIRTAEKSISTLEAVNTIVNGTNKAIQAGRMGMVIADTVNAGVGAARLSQAGVETIMGVSAFGGPIGLAIGIIVSIIIDNILDSIVEWISNKNVIILLPLWWEGKPFVAGVSGGEKILMIPSSSTATEENTGEDGQEISSDETDDITTEDN